MAIGSGLAGSPANAEDASTEIVQAFITAQVRDDYRAARALLAPDARAWYGSKSGAGTPWSVPDAWTGWDLFFNREVAYWDFKPFAGGVKASASEMSDFYRLIDRPQQRLTMTWWVSPQGRLTGVLVESLRENSKVPDRFNDFKEWAKINATAEIAYLMPAGELNPEGDRPKRFRQLLEQWRKASGLPPAKLGRTIPK